MSPGLFDESVKPVLLTVEKKNRGVRTILDTDLGIAEANRRKTRLLPSRFAIDTNLIFS